MKYTSTVTVEEAHEDGHPILHSKVSTRQDRITKRPSGAPQTKGLKRALTFEMSTEGVRSWSGSLEEMLNRVEWRNSNFVLPIFTSSSDFTSKFHEVPGFCYKRVAFEDDPLPSHIGDRSYVRFATSISHIDQTSERPKLYVEQQVSHHGQRKTIINELDFGGRVKRGEEYLFPECGDIDQNMIARDLRVRILSAHQESIVRYFKGRDVKYYGYDVTKKVYINFDRDGNSKEKMPLLGGNDEQLGEIRLSPSYIDGLPRNRTGKRDKPARGEVELFRLHYKRGGNPTADGLDCGDLDLHVILKPS